MRIVHYVPRTDLRDGGVPRFVLDIARVLAARGHPSTVLSDDITDTPRAWIEQSSGGPSEHDHRLPTVRRLGNPGIAGHYFTSGVMDQVRDQLADADVVHLHCVWSTTCMQIAAAAREMGIPYIVSLHGMLDDWCMHQRGLKKRVYLSLGGRYFLEKAARVHCTALAECEQSKKWFPHGREAVIPYLIDLEPYRTLPGPELARATFECLKDYSCPTVLFLSRLHYKKNPEVLLHALSQVAKRIADFQVVIAGTGDPVYIGSLQRLAKDLGLERQVQFVGQVTGGLKTSLYEACDLFVLPTSQENLGLVLIEALACGTPLITTRGVDIWRDIETSGAAVIAEPTPEAFSTEIANLLDSPQLLELMSAKARPWAMKHFDEGRLASRFEELYASAARSSAKAGPRIVPQVPPNDLRASA